MFVNLISQEQDADKCHSKHVKVIKSEMPLLILVGVNGQHQNLNLLNFDVVLHGELL